MDSPNMDRVVGVFVAGLKRLAQLDTSDFVTEADSVMEKKASRKAAELIAAYNDVVRDASNIYKEEIAKIHRPQTIDIKKELENSINKKMLSIRQDLRIIVVKAQNALETARVYGFEYQPELKSRIEFLSNIKTEDMEFLINLLTGVLSESVDCFGIPY